MAWMKVLCAVDFSDCSHAALHAAAGVAERDGATLTLVHVYEQPRPTDLGAEAMLAWTPGDLEAELLREAEPRIAALRAHAAALLGERRVETRLLAGRPGEEIPRLAKDGGYDLVVVGTHGRTGVKRLVLGSVAEQIVRSAPVSVLVARGGACVELEGED